MTTEYWIFKLMQALSVVNLYPGVIDECEPTFLLRRNTRTATNRTGTQNTSM